MKIEHNSHSLFCRTPFGAATCFEPVTLRLLIEEGNWPDEVKLKYEFNNTLCEKKMHFHSVLGGNYVYEVIIDMPEEPCVLFYYFEIVFAQSVLYYANNPERLGGVGNEYYKDPIPYQITVYDKNFKTPDWLKSGIMYQIFVDRFSKSDKYDSLSKRDDIIVRSWGDVPFYTHEQFGGEYLANDFFGGSLEGIIEKLDYLHNLGISVIYLNPIFKAYSNHKYDTGDYEKIDEMFGSEETFLRLCKSAEERGIKIILDGVFNHTGSDSKYFNKNNSYTSTGAYQSQSSEYYNWYHFNSFPDEYESWWGIKTLPAVNENEESYIKYILTDENSIIKRWLRLGASGWRLDVADELPSKFLEILRSEVKSTDKDFAIIGEVWEDASNKISYSELRKYFCGKQLDSVMNYPLRNALIEYIMGSIDAKTFNARIYSLYENYPYEAFMSTMNFLSSHDTIRIFTKLSGAPDSLTKQQQASYVLSENQIQLATVRTRLIYTILMCLPGMPSIFYGDELFVRGFGDPFCRSCFTPTPSDVDAQEFFKSIISMRKNSTALTKGSFDIIYGEGKTCAFIRKSDDEFKLILINTHQESDWYAPIELGRFKINNLNYNDEHHSSSNGRFILHIEPMSIKIYDSVLPCKGESER